MYKIAFSLVSVRGVSDACIDHHGHGCQPRGLWVRYPKAMLLTGAKIVSLKEFTKFLHDI